LTRLAARWLRNQGYVAYRESSSIYGPERVDVIGWRNAGFSILIECKRSRADFLRDKEKHFRALSDLGYGNMRFYLCPAGLLLPADMPPKWGLLYAYPTRVQKKKDAEPFDYKTVAQQEKRLLCAILHRLDKAEREHCEARGICLPTRSL
jgi:hypothetical protein